MIKSRRVEDIVKEDVILMKVRRHSLSRVYNGVRACVAQRVEQESHHPFVTPFRGAGWASQGTGITKGVWECYENAVYGVEDLAKEDVILCKDSMKLRPSTRTWVGWVGWLG